MEGDGLDDHVIDLVARELEFVAAEAVSEPETHLAEILLSDALQEGGDVEADASGQLFDALGVLDVHIFEVGLDHLGHLLRGDGEGGLDVVGDQVLGEELLEGLAHLSLDQLHGGLQHIVGVLERTEGLQLDELAQLLRAGHVGTEVVYLLELLGLLDAEECKSSGGFEQYQHFLSRIFY